MDPEWPGRVDFEPQVVRTAPHPWRVTWSLVNDKRQLSPTSHDVRDGDHESGFFSDVSRERDIDLEHIDLLI